MKRMRDGMYETNSRADKNRKSISELELIIPRLMEEREDNCAPNDRKNINNNLEGIDEGKSSEGGGINKATEGDKAGGVRAVREEGTKMIVEKEYIKERPTALGIGEYE